MLSEYRFLVVLPHMLHMSGFVVSMASEGHRVDEFPAAPLLMCVAGMADRHAAEFSVVLSVCHNYFQSVNRKTYFW